MKSATASLKRRRNKRIIDILDDSSFMEIYRRCMPYTMVSIERCFALYRAVIHVSGRGIPGDMVECGVWRGGSAMLMALSLIKAGETGRVIRLYDTFEGMAEPGKADYDLKNGKPAIKKWRKKLSGNLNRWCYAPLDEVKKNMASTGYPEDRIVCVKGKTEDTLTENSPEKISILRLDTDWYESTKCELKHLFPRLVSGGALILDDYGNWAGFRRAVDEYFREENIKMLLCRIDSNGAAGVKA